VKVTVNQPMSDPKKANSQPLVGIWWDDGKILVALTHPITENSSRGPLIDSNLNHWEAWPEVAAMLGLTGDDEYYDVPRGRVLVRQQTGAGLIYHGTSTPPGRLRKIAARFRLSEWTAKLDDHYQLDPDLDAMFGDD
jgi:hypothetical protein